MSDRITCPKHTAQADQAAVRPAVALEADSKDVSGTIENLWTSGLSFQEALKIDKELNRFL